MVFLHGSSSDGAPIFLFAGDSRDKGSVATPGFERRSCMVVQEAWKPLDTVVLPLIAGGGVAL